MTSDDAPRPDIRTFLESRAATPLGFSPDGARVLVAGNVPGTSQLFVRPRDGNATTPMRQVTAFDDPVTNGRFLPDGRILFSRDSGGDENHQLFLTDVDGSDVEELVGEAGVMHTIGDVSRDGRMLAYASNSRNRVDFDLHLLDLDPDGREDRIVFDAGGYVAGAAFTPDGQQIAVLRLSEVAGSTEVFLVDVATGETSELAPHPDEQGKVSMPRWLPDGETGFFSTDLGRDSLAVARVDRDGSWEVVLDTEWDAFCSVDDAGRWLLVTENVEGVDRIRLHDPTSLEVVREVPLPGAGVVTSAQLSDDGRWLAYGYSGGAVRGDCWLVDTDTGQQRRLTESPSDVDPAAIVEPEIVRFPSFDGLEVPAFVWRPQGRASRSPVVCWIHGGPESQFRPSFNPVIGALVARGFAVVAPNVRGSTGYGKRYEHLDDVGKRLDSVADMAAMHDWIASTDDLDPERAALFGGSYGGYMVLAGLVFQPERWAAGVDIVGISSLVTFLENTSPYRRKVREREYGSLDDDRDFLVEASPITHLDRLRALLFMAHGANDPRVPLSEAEQMRDALRAKGVDTELLVYDDEGHGLAKLANQLDAYPQAADFLVDHLRPG